MYAHRRAPSPEPVAPTESPRPVQPEAEPSNSELAERLPRAGSGEDPVSPASHVRRRGSPIRLLSYAPATTVEASPGEEIRFLGLFEDIDDQGQGRTVSGQDFYDIDWTATAGSFDRPGGPATAQTRCVDAPGPYDFDRRYLVGDVNAAPITVTATIRDRSLVAEARDRDFEVHWTVLPRQGEAPASIEQRSFERRSDTEFMGRYRVGPEGGSGRYHRQVVQEQLTDPRPVQMTADDIIPKGFMDSPEDIVRLLAGGTYGTFSCDENDEFTDFHGGFGDLDLVSTFRPEAVTRGISWSVVQTYTSGGRVLGRFLITRMLRGSTLTITKEAL